MRSLMIGAVGLVAATIVAGCGGTGGPSTGLGGPATGTSAHADSGMKSRYDLLNGIIVCPTTCNAASANGEFGDVGSNDFFELRVVDGTAGDAGNVVVLFDDDFFAGITPVVTIAGQTIDVADTLWNEAHTISRSVAIHLEVFSGGTSTVTFAGTGYPAHDFAVTFFPNSCDVPPRRPIDSPPDE